MEAFGAGRFVVRGTLGTGGAGVVYRAFDTQLGREVALKHLRTASGRDLLRFKREFRALADIHHPNLVALHELHAADGEWFFTMDLVEGVTFLDWVRPTARGGTTRTRADIIACGVSDARLRGAVIQLVDALIALHRAGKLHRDLKPSNVLVTAQGRVALLDFGLVAGIREGEPERLAVGTPAYMSPEQASDQLVGEPSDWYGLGCMVYEGLTGRRPFEGPPEQVMTRKQREQPAHPHTHAPKVAADLARLAMQLLLPRASERPTGLQILQQLGAAPSTTTRKLARSIPPPAFVGRAADSDELQRALGDARRRGVTVIIKGRSGLGKSTLVRRFVQGLGDAAIALEGRCFEREAVPFKMLDGVVDALTGVLMTQPAERIAALEPKELGSLLRLFPVMRRVPRFADAESAVPADPQELRRRGFAALRGMLVRLARDTPIVIFVDDAHWGDADSCSFLAELIHGGDPGVLIVVAHRPEDYLGVIAQLRRPPGGARRGDVRDVELVPLVEDDARALIAQLADRAITDEQAQAVIAAAAGNPLVLTEMARSGGPVAAKLDELVRARVQGLPPDAQSLLAVTSVAARPLPVAIAARAAGIAGSGRDAATVLVGERLATVRQVAGEAILHPAHDYVRSAVVAALGTEMKAAFHEAIAVAFEAVQPTDSAASARIDSQAIVEHWLAAGHPANAAHHAVAAAQIAEEALAFKRAAELYQIAITFGSWDTIGVRDLTGRKAHALACAGQFDAAVTEYGIAAEMLADADAVDLERLRVEALLRRGRIGEALPAAERLLQTVGLRIPLVVKTSRTKLITQWMAAKLRGLDFTSRAASELPTEQLLAIDVLYSIASGLAFTDPALGRVVQSELMRSALDAGEPVRVCLALAQELAYTAAASSRVSDTAARLDGIAAAIGAPQITGIATTAAGIAAHSSGHWRDARDRLEHGLGMLRDHGAGVRWEIDIGETYWLSTLFWLGEWREMTRHAQLLLREAVERGDIIAQHWLRSGRCNSAWLVADRPADARAHLEAATAMLGDGFQLTHAHAVLAAANLDLYAGEAASAAHRVRDAWAQIDRLGLLRMQQPRIELAMLRARIALVLRDYRAARTHVNELLVEDVPWATALGQLFAAACAAGEGHTVRAHAALAMAEPLLDATGMLGFLHIARGYRGRLDGGAAGAATIAAARDALVELGASDPDILAQHLVPWSG